MQVEPKTLVARLTKTGVQCLDAAAGAAAGAGNYEITVEHFLLQLLADDAGQTARILEHAGADRRALSLGLERSVRQMRKGHAGRPTFSQTVFQWIEESWVVASLELGHSRVCTGVLFAQLVQRQGVYLEDHHPELSELPKNLLSDLPQIIEGSSEDPGRGGSRDAAAAGAPNASADTAIARFTLNMTEQAREGRIDPVLGRHREIRQLIDILSRRRKNNPVITGEPGAPGSKPG